MSIRHRNQHKKAPFGQIRGNLRVKIFFKILNAVDLKMLDMFLKYINSYYDISNHPVALDMSEIKLPLRTKMTDYHQGREPLA